MTRRQMLIDYEKNKNEITNTDETKTEMTEDGKPKKLNYNMSIRSLLDGLDDRKRKHESGDNEKKAKKKKIKYDEETGNYDTWAPPTGQTGDGKTHLNAKFGY